MRLVWKHQRMFVELGATLNGVMQMVSNQQIFLLSMTEFTYLTLGIWWPCLSNRPVVAQLVLTISFEHGHIGDGGSQVVGCVANVFALVLLQGVHCITEGEECKWTRPFRHLQLRVIDGVERLSVLCPPQPWAAKRKEKEKCCCLHKYKNLNSHLDAFEKKAVLNTQDVLTVILRTQMN